jgi:hypothetical protein
MFRLSSHSGWLSDNPERQYVDMNGYLVFCLYGDFVNIIPVKQTFLYCGSCIV